MNFYHNALNCYTNRTTPTFIEPIMNIQSNVNYGGNKAKRQYKDQGGKGYKYQKVDSTDKVKPLGLGSEKYNTQTPQQLWLDLYQNLAAEFPHCACMIIDGVPEAIIDPPQPVMPPGLNAQARDLWKVTVLKGHTSDLERLKSMRQRNIDEEHSIASSMKQAGVTDLMSKRLTSTYAIGNPTGVFWLTSLLIADIKNMLTNAYNTSLAVLPQDRIEIGRQNFEWFKMMDYMSYDQFAAKYRDALITRAQTTGTMLSPSEECFHFLAKLPQQYAVIRSEYASGEARNNIRLSSGQLALEGIGYPTTLDELILTVQASIEASNKTKIGGGIATSYATITDGRGRGGRGRNQGRGGRGRGRGQSQISGKPQTYGQPQTHTAVGRTPFKYPDYLTHVQTGDKKKWIDLVKADNPIDYGRLPCKICCEKGKIGLHFNQFHT